MATRHRFLVDGRERTVVVDDAGGRITVAIDDGEPVEVDVASVGLPGTIGGALRSAPGVALSLTGSPVTSRAPRLGCSISTSISRASIWGEATASATVATGPNGMPAAASASDASATVWPVVHAETAPSSSSTAAIRPGTSPNRGSAQNR